MSDILRWVADQYRKELYRVDAEACHNVDLVMVRAGQSWVCDDSIVDVDELLTAKQFELKYGITENAVQKLVLRHGIPPRGKQGRAYMYRVGDILSLRVK